MLSNRAAKGITALHTITGQVVMASRDVDRVWEIEGSSTLENMEN